VNFFSRSKSLNYWKHGGCCNLDLIQSGQNIVSKEFTPKILERRELDQFPWIFPIVKERVSIWFGLSDELEVKAVTDVAGRCGFLVRESCGFAKRV
jgi:hypothetical protein